MIRTLLARDSHISILYSNLSSYLDQNIFVFGGYLSEGNYTNHILKISTQNLSHNKLTIS